MVKLSTLFRPEARKAAAEQVIFEDALQVMRPRLWLAGAVLCVACAVAVLFSFLFHIPVTVSGKGIMVSSGGLMDVVATTAGQVQSVAFAQGERVAAGTVVARISQPDLELELGVARSEQADAERSYDELVAFQARQAIALDLPLQRRLVSLEERGAALRARRAALASRLETYRALMRQGNIIRDQVLAAENDLMVVDSQIADVGDERVQLDATRATQRVEAETRLLESDLKRESARRKVAALETQLARQQVIVSPFGGRVVEIKVNVGQMVQNGTPVLALERDGNGQSRVPTLIAYVSGLDGKKVAVGMPAEISLATAPREENGSLRGRVARISDAPSSSAGMMRRLQNDRLLETFQQQLETPFEVEIHLETDAQGAVIWSSAAGTHPRVENGTLAEATVTLRELPLASLAIQALRGMQRDYAASAP